MAIRALMIAVCLVTSVGCGGSGGGGSVTVMTFNILRDEWARDEYPRWADRVELVAATIRDHQPDVVGLQEETPEQVRDLALALDSYRYIGPAHAKGGGLLIRRNTWHVVALGGIPTPEGRQAGWAVLERRLGDQQWAIYNAHYTYRGGPAGRLETSKVIAAHIADRVPEAMPLALTGDFNATLDEPPMRYLFGEDGSPVALRDAVSESPRRDEPRGTIHGFTGKLHEPGIDHVLVNDNVEVLSTKIIRKDYFGKHPSDHYPVQVKLRRKR